ncbi:hypothetical protein VSS86_20425, partial [Bacillus safensis]|nr:hypothetical protein [Bacillus safensis]
DFRKSVPEFEITEIQLVMGEIAHTIRHLRRWMHPRRVPTPPLLKGTAFQTPFPWVKLAWKRTLLGMFTWPIMALLTAFSQMA